MELGINKKQAEELVDRYIEDPVTRLHLVESEAIMRALARKFGEDEEKWGIIGFLHDIDWEMTKNNTAEHCLKAVDILKEVGASDFLIQVIQSHGYGYEGNELADEKRETKLEHSLAAAETLTGLIIASALMQPDKKLESLSVDSLKRKFKNKKFAQKCNRGIIMECEKAGLSLDEFLEIGLKALQGIHQQLGL